MAKAPAPLAAEADDLPAFKAAMADKSRRLITSSAIRDGAALGCSTDDMAAVIQSVEAKHFYKSMPSTQNPPYTQHVYHVPHSGKVLYVKYTADPKLKLLSFKER